MARPLNVTALRTDAILTLARAAAAGDTQAAAALVQALERVPRVTPPSRPRSPKDPVARLRALLSDTDASLASARAAGAWSAVAAMTRRMLDIHRQLDAAVLAAAAPAPAPTKATAAAMLAAAMTEAAVLPEADRREILADFARALGLSGPSLRLVDGGGGGQ